MYIVYYGSNREGVRDGATTYIDKNFPANATLTTLEGDSYQVGQVTNSLGAESLFGDSQWFLLDTPSDNPEFEKEVKASLKEMSESTNTFIILEGGLLAEAKKVYGKHTKNIFEFTLNKAKAVDPFALPEALATKDKRKLWVLLQEARLAGQRDEDIIGLLWWQLKALRLAKITRNADEAGMKEFPYSKAKRALGKFGDGEVEKLSHSLLELYHDGHAGRRDMDMALEEWVLSI